VGKTLPLSHAEAAVILAAMYLKCHRRLKDGKEHRYWSIVESHRLANGGTAKRQVLYLGEINDSQREAWCRMIEAFEDGEDQPRQIALFPQDRRPEKLPPDTQLVQVDLSRLEIHRPRQWGACWLILIIWQWLKLDAFWRPRLPLTRKGTDYYPLLLVHVCNRLVDPGSEWFIHRHWYRQTALSDLLDLDAATLPKNPLYHCLDQLLKHKQALFSHLCERWKTLFDARCEVLLYDLTSTYFECDPPAAESGSKKKFGYSRDKRSDCVQVVIALVVTPEGFPLAYEVLPGNTQDKQTLKDFLVRIEDQYGRAERVWVMDRGIPTEDVLREMRESDPPVRYVVGAPKGRLTRYEESFLSKPWNAVRENINVKVLKDEEDGELFVLVRSDKRVGKERSMRRRRLKKLWKRLEQLKGMKQSRDQLLMRLGAARNEAGRAYGLIAIHTPREGEPVDETSFRYTLDREKLREARRREGSYLIRTNLPPDGQEGEPEGRAIWSYYMQLVEIEEAFKNLKGDLGIRPIYHRLDERIEAHIFVCFLAYCVQVSLREKLKSLAGGLTPRAVIEKFATMQMVDVHLPVSDGRRLKMARYTQPDRDLKLLMARMGLELPPQPPPRITSAGELASN
jgi:transposase